MGSNSNVAENGLEQEQGRALIMEFDLNSAQARPYATGLRNPNGMDWQSQNGALWTVVNERDELGNDLVPDYLTSVKEGAFMAGLIVIMVSMLIHGSNRKTLP